MLIFLILHRERRRAVLVFLPLGLKCIPPRQCPASCENNHPLSGYKYKTINSC